MSSTNTSRPGPGSLLAPCVSLGVLAVCLVFVFSRTMQRALDHDEHQFVASAATWARHGLLPYRDFPHFHMPYLVWLYGFGDVLTGRPFLVARLVSVAAAWLTMLLVHGAVRRAVPDGRPWARHLLASGTALALLFNPLFTYTSGLAWNHDLAVLLATAAFLAATRAGTHGPRMLLAGVLLGLATGVRLSVAPLGAPLLLVALASAGPGRRLAAAARFVVGAVAALMPALALAALAPGEALFDNLGYPALNTAYRVQEGFTRAMDLPGKLRYIALDVFGQPGNLLLVAFLLAGCVVAPLRGDGRDASRRRLVLGFLPFLLLGGFAPTPSWYQYFYALVPFALLGGALGTAAAVERRGARVVGGLLLVGCVGASAWATLPDYRTLSNLRDPASWTPERERAAGLEVRALLGPVPHDPSTPDRAPRVLTLGPVACLEAGLDVDPAFASGPFAWRSAGFLTPEERATHGLVGPDELAAHLDARPPDAVLLGCEKRGEEPLVGWADARGWTAHALADGRVLRTPPAR